MKTNLARKWVLITGASSGFGAATARAFAAEGCHLLLGARRVDRLEAVAAECRKLGAATANVCKLDVSNTPSTDEFAKWVRSLTDKVDVLINNAGGAHGLDTVANGRDEDWEAMIQSNFLGVMRVTRAMLPLMVNNPGSSILNIGSIAGRVAYEGGSVYCGVKAAELQITRALRLELSGTDQGGDSAGFKGMWTLYFWLRDVINRNLPYDQFVRLLVAGQGSSLENPAITFGVTRVPKVESIPQLFLGVRLECAQCHDHPFDVWKQSDYNALREFFSDVTSKEGPGDFYGREIRVFIPPERFLPWERDKQVTLRLLDGSTVEVAAHQDRRTVLADWLFGPAKQQTARAIVNRVWGKFFGRGITDPVDDMRFSNPPVNEPLLQSLADDFIAHRYDFKHLVRTILNSRTYQLSSISNATNERETMNFSHARLRRLPAEQLLDAVSSVTGVDESFRVGPPGGRAIQIPYTRIGSRFLTMFGRPEQRMSPCECIRSHEATLPQVLHLLNGETVGQKLRAEGGTLHRLLQANFSDPQLVEELYMTVLNRPPSDRERNLGHAYMRDSASRAEGAEDFMWALLTSQEFLFNH